MQHIIDHIMTTTWERVANNWAKYTLKRVREYVKTMTRVRKRCLRVRELTNGHADGLWQFFWERHVFLEDEFEHISRICPTSTPLNPTHRPMTEEMIRQRLSRLSQLVFSDENYDEHDSVAESYSFFSAHVKPYSAVNSFINSTSHSPSALNPSYIGTRT